jgi:hypothetical protein
MSREMLLESFLFDGKATCKSPLGDADRTDANMNIPGMFYIKPSDDVNSEVPDFMAASDGVHIGAVSSRFQGCAEG